MGPTRAGWAHPDWVHPEWAHPRGPVQRSAPIGAAGCCNAISCCQQRGCNGRGVVQANQITLRVH